MRSELIVSQQTLTVVDFEQKGTVEIDVPNLVDSNIRKMEHKKTEKYQELKEQLEQM